VHLLNPYGFDKSRKFNENNVDLSRNLLTDEEFKEVLARDPDIYGYESLEEVINPKKVMNWFDELLYWPGVIKKLFQ